MAKKEQCCICTGYNVHSELCTIKWCQLSFDGECCPDFRDKNQPVSDVKSPNRENNTHNDNSKEQNNNDGVTFTRIRKRGKSIQSHVASVKSQSKATSDIDDKESPYVLDIPVSLVRVFIICLLILVIGGLGYGGYYYIQQTKIQERENLVWKARVKLEEIRSEKTINYLRLHNIEYEDKLLKLAFMRNLNQYGRITEASDSLIYKEFTSIIAINSNRWDSICNILIQAETNLSVTYSDVHLRPRITIPYQKLADKLLSKNVQQEGLRLFVKKKEEEVLEYARIHFSDDRIFTVDSVSSYGGYVALYLSYDDTVARLGKSYLDKERVNVHFTDPVGEMGSILDGMLSISTFTNSGIAFVYTGKKNHKVDSCKWDAEKAREIAKLCSGYLLIDGRKTNQIKTAIIREE